MITISHLVTTHLQAGNEDAVVRWCRDGLDRCEEINLLVDDREREFYIARASVVKTAERTEELYMYAMAVIVHNNHETAFKALRETWNRRNQFDYENDIYPVILRGGVGLAAHMALFDSDKLSDEPERILDVIADEHEQLSRPASVLYEYLQTGDAPVTPKMLVEEFQTEGEEERSLIELEAVAYARLCALQESAD